MIKVLHLIHGFGGGGAERQLSYLAPALGSLDLEVHVGFVSTGLNSKRLQGAECEMHQLSASSNHDPRLALSVFKLIRRLRPTFVQTWLPQMDLLGGTAALALGIPHILSERSSELAYSANIKSKTRRMIGRRAAAIVSNSKQGIDYWQFVPDTVSKTIIPNGLPTAELEKFRRERDASACDTNCQQSMLFIGRFTDAKNVLTVVDAMIEVARRRENISGYLFGEGLRERQMVEMIARAGFEDRIQILGYSEDVWQQLVDASVLVSLSAYEGQPNAVLEAATIGCPMVLSRIPAHQEVLNGDGAIFVGANKNEAATAILNAISDRGSTLQRIHAARKSVAKMSIEESARRYQALYLKLFELAL
jgi:glycosyltransferase involved in cell wall biosynthesis